jgi:hypothetical protein
MVTLTISLVVPYRMVTLLLDLKPGFDLVPNVLARYRMVE